MPGMHNKNILAADFIHITSMQLFWKDRKRISYMPMNISHGSIMRAGFAQTN